MAALAAGLTGLLFALGLGLGGMTDPARVVGFLDLAGNWDPSLLFVMGGAVATHTLLRHLILRRNRPLLSPVFPVTGKLDVDSRLVAGAALFGTGWGLSGYCPGPALAALTTGTDTVLLFVGAMLAGMGLFQLGEKVVNRKDLTVAHPSPHSTP